MKIGESVKGKDLVLEERDLLVMAGNRHLVHVVFDHRICRPSTVDGKRERGDRLWTKVGSCERYEDFKVEVQKLGCQSCSKCCGMLERNGIVLLN
jgi:hypothetical protein